LCNNQFSINDASRSAGTQQNEQAIPFTADHDVQRHVRIAVVDSLLSYGLKGQQDWSNFKPKDFLPQVEEALTKIEAGIAAGPYKAHWDSLEGYEIPDWYKNAKLGVFIHWGPYWVAENGWEWYPRAMYIEKNLAAKSDPTSLGNLRATKNVWIQGSNSSADG